LRGADLHYIAKMPLVHDKGGKKATKPTTNLMQLARRTLHRRGKHNLRHWEAQ